jgi:RND family efflux transporter MFP subunit
MTELKDDLAALRIEREPERRRRGGGKALTWIIVLLVLGAGGYGAWRWTTAARPIEVETAKVTERAAGTQAAVLNASGYVTARRRATVSSKVTGKVVEVNVEEGMAVREGQVLARLDDAQYKAALGLAMAQLEAAKRTVRENEVRRDEAQVTLKRLAMLVKDGFATQAEADAAKATIDSNDARIFVVREQVKVAEQQVVVEQTNLDNTIIRAPFSGVAISKDAQPGEMVSPVSAGGGFTRTGICTIVDMRSLEIEVDVNESYINRVKSDQGVTAVLDAYQDWQIPAHVITMVPTADRQKATVLVRIGFEKLDPRILPDMGVKVTFLRDAEDANTPAQRPVTLVPKAAIKTEGTQTIAFVVVNGVIERRAVKTGGTDGDRLEVLAGLSAGDTVVLSPPATLAAGIQVTTK